MSCVRKIILYRLGLVAILSGGLGFMTVAANHTSDAATPNDLDGLKGPVHALDEIPDAKDRPPSNWI